MGTWRRLGMGCQKVKEGGRELGVDLRAENERNMEWSVWKKSGAAVSWENTEEEKRRREPTPCLALINLMGNSYD